MHKIFTLALWTALALNLYGISIAMAAKETAIDKTAPDFTLQYAGKSSNETLSLYEHYLAQEGTFKVLALAFLSASAAETFKELEFLATTGDNNSATTSAADGASDTAATAPDKVAAPKNDSEMLRSLKLLTALYTSYHDKGFELLIIITDKDPGKVAAFTNLAAKKKYSFPLLWDRHGIVFNRYRVNKMPQTTLLGPDGKIFKVQENFSSAAGREFNVLIRKNLGLPLDAPLPPALEEFLKSK